MFGLNERSLRAVHLDQADIDAHLRQIADLDEGENPAAGRFHGFCASEVGADLVGELAAARAAEERRGGAASELRLGRLRLRLDGQPAGFVGEHANVALGDRLAGKELRGEHQHAHERRLVRHAPFEHQRIDGVVANVAAKDAPHGDVLAADGADGVANLFFEQRRQRIELDQVDHGARGRESDPEAGCAPPAEAAGACGARGGAAARSGVATSGCAAPRIAAGVEVVAGNRLGGQRRLEVRHEPGQHERIAIGRALHFNRRMDAR